MKFTKKMSYYPADVLPVYEFNLPAGHSCPYADVCILTASYGSLHDDLIEEYGLRSVEVFDHLDDVPKGMEIDTDDSLAMKHGDSFALLNNFKRHDLK